jgi:hypothetical protein
VFFLIFASFAIFTFQKRRNNFDWKTLKSIQKYRVKILSSNIKTLYWILIWLSIPIVLQFILSLFSSLNLFPYTINPLYSTKYTIGASFAFYILTAKGILKITSKQVKTTIIGIFLIISLVNVLGYYTEVKKEQWRDVAADIENNAEPGDLLLFNAGFCQNIVFDYYSKRADLIKKPFPEETRSVNEENIKTLGPTLKGYHRVWVILSHSGDSEGRIISTISESYNESYHRTYVGIEVYLFEKKM